MVLISSEAEYCPVALRLPGLQNHAYYRPDRAVTPLSGNAFIRSNYKSPPPSPVAKPLHALFHDQPTGR
ncbi:hypothetical protein BW105_10205 [Salmonella enterica]|nr:hypothetical protein [Salmonella enterica]